MGNGTIRSDTKLGKCNDYFLPRPNPLLVPLAGHELGHSYWAKEQLGSTLEPLFRQQVVAAIKNRWQDYQQVFQQIQIPPGKLNTDLKAYETWATALKWSLRQAEETFCDFLGLRIFGVSYLEAFAYLLAPNDLGARLTCYPEMRQRIANLVKAAIEYKVKVRSGYEDQFDDFETPDLTSENEFRLEVADEALDKSIPVLIKQADDVIKAAGIQTSTPQEVKKILERFKLVVPAEGSQTLADILNAAWAAFLNQRFWEDISQIKVKREKVLKELVLKNIEIFEIEQILKE